MTEKSYLNSSHEHFVFRWAKNKRVLHVSAFYCLFSLFINFYLNIFILFVECFALYDPLTAKGASDVFSKYAFGQISFQFYVTFILCKKYTCMLIQFKAYKEHKDTKWRAFIFCRQKRDQVLPSSAKMYHMTHGTFLHRV